MTEVTEFTERSIHASWTDKAIEVAAAEGIDEALLRRLAGIEQPPDTTPIGRHISEQRHLAMWSALMQARRDPGFPIRFARAVTLDDYGLLGLAYKTSTDLREALAQAGRYLHVWTNSYELSLLEVWGRARVVLRHSAPDSVASRCDREAAVAALVNVMGEATRQKIRPLAVHFTHARPSAIDEHRAFFGCPVRFESSYDGVELDGATMELTIALADPGLSRYLLAQLDRLAEAAPNTSLEARVRHAVANALPTGRAPSVETVADSIGLTRRTLQRRLAEAGTSFRNLVEQARRELARQLLAETGRPLAEVAFMLGFSEPSAFYRAFKRWTGQTPSDFRGAADNGALDRVI